MFKQKKGSMIVGELWTQLALLIVILIALVVLWAILVGLAPKNLSEDVSQLTPIFQNENYYNLKFFLEENDGLIKEFLIKQDEKSEEALKTSLDSFFPSKKYSLKIYYDMKEFNFGEKFDKYYINMPFFVKENKIAAIYFENDIKK